MPSISACVITKNEEEKLLGCLKSLGWASEVVVVDDFSEDRTSEICQSFDNVKYYTRKFDGFGMQKVSAVKLASCQWILNVDADEEVSSELRDEILRTINGTTSEAGFYIRRNNLIFGKFKIDDYPGSLRLFNKNFGNFRDEYVHEKVTVQGETGQLEGFLIHRPKSMENYHNYYDVYVVKYGKLAAMDYKKKGICVTLWSAPYKIILLPFLIFGREYVVKRKCLLGFWGFFSSVCSALCYHVAYRHLWGFSCKEKSK
jgi:glycosyltransferase involved in cell wall biosynthesis